MAYSLQVSTRKLVYSMKLTRQWKSTFGHYIAKKSYLHNVILKYDKSFYVPLVAVFYGIHQAQLCRTTL